ncbi:MAG: hypothetical protein CL920_13685 [Deltaproteobacteria bacterium]|nr:hypothetical protein [Deltaproteobacteria bacterium]MBU49742.1 hypothetical protein [Deltaproteobacteria bacterium]
MMFLCHTKCLKYLSLAALLCILYSCANSANIPKVCKPSEQVCDGVNLKVCYLDGSGYTPLECPENKPCFEGECTAPSQIPITKRKSCKSGEKVCYEGGVYACVADLSGFALIQACTNNEFCEGGRCQTDSVCRQEQRKCDGQDVMICKDDLSGYRNLLTCGAGEICESGVCRKPPICKVNELKCIEGNVFKCNAAQTQFEAHANCAGNEECKNGKCELRGRDGCRAGQRNCLGNTVGLCDPNSGVFLPLTACPVDLICKEGRCTIKKSSCSPGEIKCLRDTLQACKADGSGFDFVASCTKNEFCIEGRCEKRKVCTSPDDCNLPSEVCADPIKGTAVSSCGGGHCFCAFNTRYPCLDVDKNSCGKFKCIKGVCQ